MSDRSQYPHELIRPRRGVIRACVPGVVAAVLVGVAAPALGAVELLWLGPVVAGAVADLGLRSRTHVRRPALVAASLAVTMAFVVYLVALAIALAAFPNDFGNMG